MYLLHSSPVQPRTVRLTFALFALLLFTLSGVASTQNTPSAPPDFTDTAHVMNGCFISSTAYLAKFHAEFPGEQARTLTVTPRNYEMTHTIAVVSWTGRWWGRDEYFGVFALNAKVSDNYTEVQLQRKASGALETFSATAIREGTADAMVVRRQLTESRRSNEVATAAGLLPCATEEFSVESNGKQVRFLLFRPTPELIAVYTPVSGTATAHCALRTNSTGIIRNVAAQLGYKVDAVHAVGLSNASLVAQSPKVASLR
jgi:hypothetical protein